MSGGSFDYLSSRDLVSEARGSEIEHMRDTLHEMGHHDAALRTGEALAALKRADAIRVELEDVWHSVEWVVSCDYGKGDEAKALEAWRAKGTVDPARVDLARRIYELEQEALALRVALEAGGKP